MLAPSSLFCHSTEAALEHREVVSVTPHECTVKVCFQASIAASMGYHNCLMGNERRNVYEIVALEIIPHTGVGILINNA